MTNARKIEKALQNITNENNYLFSTSDMRSLVPELEYGAFKSLIHRMCKNGDLIRLSKDLFLFPRTQFVTDNVLYHAAAKFRDAHFNYLSLETVLSREGLISQVPFQWISLMSSGRSYQLLCEGYGTIEFVHTKRKPSQMLKHLYYDPTLRLWVADKELALQDMKLTHRSMDLVET